MNMKLWWRHWRGRARFERDLDEELAFHRDARAADLERQGLSPGDALRQARIELGMVEMHKDAVRRAYGLAMIDTWLGELRHALTSLMRSPHYSLVAILILGAAMGLNLMLFSIYQNYAWRAPKLPGDGMIVDVVMHNAKAESRSLLSLEEIEQLRVAMTGQARALLPMSPLHMMLGGDTPRTAYGASVDAEHFTVLGAKARLGRVFGAAERAVDANPTIVLSDHGWRLLASADPSIVGKTLPLGGQTFTVVGVMAPDFVDLQAMAPQFWISSTHYQAWQRQQAAPIDLMFELSAVLDDAERIAPLSQRWLAVMQAAPGRQQDDQKIATLSLEPRRSLLAAGDAEDLRLAAMPVFALLLLILIVACANLANLMLARALAKRQELAIRASLGASRWRLLRQLLSECALLAIAASGLGMIICWLGADPLHRYALSLLLSIGLEPIALEFDGLTLMYAGLLALLATLAFGLLPALAMTESNLAEGVRRDARLGAISPTRLRSALMVLQVAASLVLLLNAALIVGATMRADRLDLGFAADQLIDLRHPSASDELRARIEQLPGVRASTAVLRTPLAGVNMRRGALIDRQSELLGFNLVDERYFQTLGLRLQQGRGFRLDEARNRAPVAVISAATARRYWPNRNAVGEQIEFPAEYDEPAQRLQVIGVVDDIASGLLIGGRDASMVYLPASLDDSGLRNLLVATDPARVADIRRALISLCHRLDPSTLCEPTPLPELIAVQRMPFTIAARLAGALGCAALLISAIGLYGVVRYFVGSRTRDIGVRAALGAAPGSLMRWVMRGAVRQVLLGIALALPLCLLLSYGLSRGLGLGVAFAPTAYLGAIGLLLLTALLAAALPARAAMRIAPTEALRQD